MFCLSYSHTATEEQRRENAHTWSRCQWWCSWMQECTVTYNSWEQSVLTAFFAWSVFQSVGRIGQSLEVQSREVALHLVGACIAFRCNNACYMLYTSMLMNDVRHCTVRTHTVHLSFGVIAILQQNLHIDDMYDVLLSFIICFSYIFRNLISEKCIVDFVRNYRTSISSS